SCDRATDGATPQPAADGAGLRSSAAFKRYAAPRAIAGRYPGVATTWLRRETGFHFLGSCSKVATRFLGTDSDPDGAVEHDRLCPRPRRRRQLYLGVGAQIGQFQRPRSQAPPAARLGGGRAGGAGACLRGAFAR